jgi:hypothetical protein
VACRQRVRVGKPGESTQVIRKVVLTVVPRIESYDAFQFFFCPIRFTIDKKKTDKIWVSLQKRWFFSWWWSY